MKTVKAIMALLARARVKFSEATMIASVLQLQENIYGIIFNQHC
jgi:hypothetical protein